MILLDGDVNILVPFSAIEQNLQKYFIYMRHDLMKVVQNKKFEHITQ